jgi:hypothetical protein
MSSNSITRALQFVASVELPEPPPVRRGVTRGAGFNFDAAKDQAAVVGSDVISFVKGVTAEQRNDIVNASLLAQLVAKRKVAEPKTLAEVKAWYDNYFDALSHVGFLIQDKGFAEYEERSENFEAHQAIQDVAAALLAGSPGALMLIKTTLQALQRMSTDSPWITLFNRESQSANTARFQMSLVDQDDTARFLISLIAFGLEARTTLTQVLFFKFRTNEVALNHHSGKVTINAQLLAHIRGQIATKLAAYTDDYFRGLDL